MSVIVIAVRTLNVQYSTNENSYPVPVAYSRIVIL